MMNTAQALLSFSGLPIHFGPGIWIFPHRRFRREGLRGKRKALGLPLNLPGLIRSDEMSFDRAPVEPVLIYCDFTRFNFNELALAKSIADYPADLHFPRRDIRKNESALFVGFSPKGAKI